MAKDILRINNDAHNLDVWDGVFYTEVLVYFIATYKNSRRKG